MEDNTAARSNYMGQKKNALYPGIGHRVEQAKNAQRGNRRVAVFFL
jgi:hypothetical protein